MIPFEAAFLRVLNMSITASYVAVGVILVRALLRKSPKVFSYVLWSVVLFRLVCPVSIPLSFSILGVVNARTEGPRLAEYVPQTVGTMPVPTINSGIQLVDNTVNRVLPQVVPAASVNPMQIAIAILSLIWVTGIVVILAYSVVSYVKMKRRLDTATLVKDNIFESDQIGTAFVCGLIHPKIYIPTGIPATDLSYILEHERTHIRRLDYLVKPLAFLALVLHWFNPLMWLSFALMGRDMEMSCDEAVLAKLDAQAKIRYSGSLLSLSIKRSGLLVASPLAFSESDVKARIKNVLNYKRSSVIIIIVALVAVSTALVAFASNPQAKFNIDKTQAQAMLFSTDHTDPVQIGEVGVYNYYSTFMGKSIPADYRISDYTITDIQLMAGDINEFCVLVTGNYSTTSMFFFSANGNFQPVDGGYNCEGDVKQFRIKSLGGNNYEITGMGTGGLDAGLKPVIRDDTASPPTGSIEFDLAATRARAMTFISDHTDLIKVGEQGIRDFHATFFGDSIPEEYRLTEYDIADIRLIAGDNEEFCVGVISNYRTTGLYWLSANGSFRPVDGGYLGEGDYKQFRIKYLKGSLYQIVDFGTGGLTQGLEPVEQTNPGQPGDSELDRVVRDLVARNWEIFRIFRLGMLPMEIPDELKPGEHIFPVKDDRFKSFVELEAYIRYTYVKEQADALLSDGHYMDVDGRLHGDMYKEGGMGYYTDWVNYHYTLSEVTADSALITINTGSYTPMGPEEINLTVRMKKVNGQWLLEKMIS